MLKKYKVMTKRNKFLGYKPGEVFEAELDESKADRWIALGRIKEIKPRKTIEDTPKEVTPDA